MENLSLPSEMEGILSSPYFGAKNWVSFDLNSLPLVVYLLVRGEYITENTLSLVISTLISKLVLTFLLTKINT